MSACFYDLTLEQLQSNLQGLGKEKYRAQQLYQWVYQKKVTDFDEMTNLSKKFRHELPENFNFYLPEMISHLKSQLDGTRKFLFRLNSGETVESVLIPSDGRRTLCVSSEVGCNMGCTFCFTGKQKLKRRLTAGEVVGQFLKVSEEIPEDERITNIVFMGMGEPLDNPEAVFGAIKILNSPWGLNFSRKKVTVSTSGIVPKIDLIAESGARLAISLNATTDKLRDVIMPINKKYPLEVLLDSCEKYYQKTKDRITFEYVLLKDVNDSLADARRIKKLTKHIPGKINLIPFNEHPGSGFKRPSTKTVHAFQKELMDMGMHVLIRRTMGRDIYAACGQLTSKIKDHPIRMTQDQIEMRSTV